MSNEFLVVPAPEGAINERLDELTLYLEICKHENILSNLKQDAISISGNQIKFQGEITQQKHIITNYMNMLVEFGIDPTDSSMITEWKHACYTFLNNLTMEEYIKFARLRSTCQNLDFFCNSQKGSSAFLKQEEKAPQKTKIS